MNDFKPDVIHVNNFQRQLSASIIKAANDKSVPVVFTAHDLQAICPAITMQDAHGNICELCTGGKYLNCFKKRCIKNSTAKSLLGAIEGYYYKNKKIYKDKISCIITPSEFVRKKFLNDGISPNKVVVLHNYVETKDYNIGNKEGDYAFFFGRLSQEKGINNLIQAFSKLEKGKLYIAGDGPEKENIEEYIKQNNLSERIKMIGYQNKDEIIKYISECRFVVVPSTCNENCPYSIIETMAVGKPIIASNNGGIPELVINEETGFTYKCEDVNELSEKMNILFSDNNIVDEFSRKAKELSKYYDKEEYYKEIIKIYRKVIKGEK